VGALTSDTQQDGTVLARVVVVAKKNQDGFLPIGVSFNGLKMSMYKTSTATWCF
jgi:hypothetical protein